MILGLCRAGSGSRFVNDIGVTDMIHDLGPINDSVVALLMSCLPAM